MKFNRIRIAIVAVILLVVVTGILYFQLPEAEHATSANAVENELTNLKSFAQFRAVFANDSGHVRLISILSPV